MISDFYSPHTKEHIRTTNGADWMGRAGTQPPEYDPDTQSAFFDGGQWVIKDFTPAKQVPTVVSMRQARLALLGAGLLDDVQAAVEFGDRAMQISWEFATEVRRDDALVLGLAKSLNLSPDQVDDLFIQAAGY